MATSNTIPKCPLCWQDLGSGGLTTIVDNTPWVEHHQPPVSVPVHRGCARRWAAGEPLPLITEPLAAADSPVELAARPEVAVLAAALAVLEPPFVVVPKPPRPSVETRPYTQLQAEHVGNRVRLTLQCPFCQRAVQVWSVSLAGAGKRCQCGAKFEKSGGQSSKEIEGYVKSVA